MSDSPEEPWSDSPNAPHISTELHDKDKLLFIGRIIGAIAYGMPVHVPLYRRSPCLFNLPF